jgi:hypothetical protein
VRENPDFVCRDCQNFGEDYIKRLEALGHKVTLEACPAA